MLISTSILKIQQNNDKVFSVINSNTDMIHLDIMDGKFVSNMTINEDNLIEILNGCLKPIDIHFMTYNLKEYIDKYKPLKPEYITFHPEASNNIMETINYIKSNKIGAGIAIKPDTDISSIEWLLPYVDLVLVMSVNPGLGGQKFMEESIDKIEYLKKRQNEYSYLIEVDGGINIDNIYKVRKVDIAVCGSYITDSNNYNEKIDELKNKVI